MYIQAYDILNNSIMKLPLCGMVDALKATLADSENNNNKFSFKSPISN